MASESDIGGPNRRLRTWKEIGVFLDRDERTAKRWEVERGLPVHRVPGGARARVYAHTHELAHWLKTARQDAAPPPPPTPSPPTAPPPPADTKPTEPLHVQKVGSPHDRRRFRPGLIAAGGFAVAVLILAPLVWRHHVTAPIAQIAPTAHGRPRPSEAYVRGEYEWSKRTPQSLDRAVDAFTQAVIEDPHDPRPLVGLANCYLLMRQYSTLPPEIAFQKAEAAARTAIALDDRSAGAHAALAFAEFYGAWRFDAARAEFERAIALDPSNATAHHWYANALMTLGEDDEAIREIDRALSLEPTSSSILADRGMVYGSSGRRAQGMQMLRDVANADPGFFSAHAWLASFMLVNGDDAGYLREVRAAATIRGDADILAVVAAGQQGLKRGGRAGMLSAIISVQRAQIAAGRGRETALARSYAAAGDKSDMLAALRRALRRREWELVGLKEERVFRPFLVDPEYKSILRAIGLNPSASARL